MIEEQTADHRGSPQHAPLAHSAFTGFHWKAMITSGMGFFTDAYDLFIKPRARRETAR